MQCRCETRLRYPSKETEIEGKSFNEAATLSPVRFLIHFDETFSSSAARLSFPIVLSFH